MPSHHQRAGSQDAIIEEQSPGKKQMKTRNQSITIENLSTPNTVKIEETKNSQLQEPSNSDQNRNKQLLRMPNIKKPAKIHKLASLGQFTSSLLDSSYGDSFAGDQNLLASEANLLNEIGQQNQDDQERNAIPSIRNKSSKLSSKGHTLFKCCPRPFQLHLKNNVTTMTVITCYVYDFVIFLILTINLKFGQQGLLKQSEISLAFSCLMFGFMFDLFGRKQIFTMRVCVTSIATILVPYITFFPITSLALVMSSVSLTVPFIPDLISFGNRGLVYSYMGLVFTVAIVIIQLHQIQYLTLQIFND